MGDDKMEDRGENLAFDSFDMKIGQTRFPIKAGGRMTRKARARKKRIAHHLRTLARIDEAAEKLMAEAAKAKRGLGEKR